MIDHCDTRQALITAQHDENLELSSPRIDYAAPGWTQLAVSGEIHKTGERLLHGIDMATDRCFVVPPLSIRWSKLVFDLVTAMKAMRTYSCHWTMSSVHRTGRGAHHVVKNDLAAHRDKTGCSNTVMSKKCRNSQPGLRLI
ncbi:hypothetical protein A5668_14950 [Mycolicibacterium fortuitum]|nr:hypothetical protein A5668_14950 [Mycolicibacterium fortuitum]